MSENLSPIDHLLTPEYWDGHGIEDSCEHPESYSMVELLSVGPQHRQDLARMASRLGEQFEKMQLMGDEVAVASLAKFGKGNIFRPDDHPHGTLVRVSSEMITGIDQPTYDTAEQLGFVVNTEGIELNEGKNAILYVAGSTMYGGLSDDINVGEVTHQMMGANNDVHYIQRVVNLDIVSIGGGSKSYAEKGKSPNRRIFGYLIPQPA